MSQVLLGKPSVGFFGLIDLNNFKFNTTLYLLACSLIIMTLLSFSMKVILRQMSETIGVNLSLMIFERVTNHREYRIDTEKVTVSDTVNFLTKYVANFTSGLLPASLSFIADTVSLFAIVAFVFFQEPVVMALLVPPLIISMIGFDYASKKYLIKFGAEDNVRTGNIIALSKDTVRASKEISVLNKHTFFSKKLQSELEKLRVISVLSEAIKLAPRTFFEVTLFTALTIFIVVSNSSGGIENAISSMSVVFAAAYRMVPQASSTVRSINTFRSHKNTVEIIHGLIFRTEQVRKHAEQSNRREVALRARPGFAIDVSGLWFKYPDATSDLFQNLCFSVKAGEMFGLFGPSGAGKSTLLDLLLGFKDPQKGSILFNLGGKALAPRDAIDQIGYIPQEPFVFSDTLENNIKLNDQDEKDKGTEINQLLKLANVDFSNDLNQEINEDGTNLSLGQKQRISIARALNTKPQILVIDEFSASLDRRNTELIVTTIKDLIKRRGLTVIMVTHDEFVKQFCDDYLELN